MDQTYLNRFHASSGASSETSGRLSGCFGRCSIALDTPPHNAMATRPLFAAKVGDAFR
jgi:hypothetical protein